MRIWASGEDSGEAVEVMLKFGRWWKRQSGTGKRAKGQEVSDGTQHVCAS